MESKVRTDKSYKTMAWLGSWRQRSSAIWSLATIGLVAGLATGLIAALAPVAVGAYSMATASGILLQAAAHTAVIGMTTGLVVGGLVGSSSGASAAVAEEQERRQRIRDEALGIEVPEIPPPAQRPRAKLFNAKVGLAFAALGVIGGLVMLAATPIALPGIGLAVAAAGGASTTAGILAGTAYTIGMMAAFGAFFGINIPEITLRTNKIFGSMLNGRALGTNWDKDPLPMELEQQPRMRTPCIERTAEEGPAPVYRSSEDTVQTAPKASEALRKNTDGFANTVTAARTSEEHAQHPTR